MRNPQSDGIVERSHRAVAQVIRTLVALKPPNSDEEAERLVDSALSQAMHASRCASNSQLLNYSPGSIAFGRDMHLDIPIMADIISLHTARQYKIDTRLLKANAKRIHKDYQVGDQVYALTDRKTKVKPIYTGPHAIERVHTNGTVTIRRGPNVRERLNIRQVKPAKV